MEHIAGKHCANSKSKHANTNHPLSHFLLRRPPSTSTEESEEGREREREKDNLIGNTLLYFVCSDFEMRLEEPQVNEEK